MDLNSRDDVIIYTDGACSGNPGPGGWGVLLKYKGNEKEISGFSKNTTNNQMELIAAINALKSLKRRCSVILHTDSSYLKNGITSWIYKWKKNNWKTTKNKPVKNVELWQELDKLVNFHDVNWVWVKAHAGNEGNEIADNLARSAINEALNM